MTVSSSTHIAYFYSGGEDNNVWPGQNRVYTFTPANEINNFKLTNAFGTPILWLKPDAANFKNYSYTIVSAPTANRTTSSERGGYLVLQMVVGQGFQRAGSNWI
jgi:hypothetical protein